MADVRFCLGCVIEFSFVYDTPTVDFKLWRYGFFCVRESWTWSTYVQSYGCSTDSFFGTRWGKYLRTILAVAIVVG